MSSVIAEEVAGEECDVAIIGGGMVGASLALMLSALPLRVVLVEARPPEAEDQPSFDARTTALSNGSRDILTTLGVWDGLAAEATPIRAIHVSEQGRFGRAVIDAAGQGLLALGHVVPNRSIGRELWRRLRHAERIRVLSPASVREIATGDARVTLDLDAGRPPVHARLVVAADGAESLVRTQSGVAVTRRDYAQTAIVTSVSPARFHGHVAYERFTPQGPLAVLPQAEGRCAVILTVDPDTARSAAALPEPEFLRLVQDRFGWRLGAFSQLGRRDLYPLALTAAAGNTASRVALIGSAAQGLHPIAGQGFNLGLRDAATLAEVLADAQAEGATDAGASESLARYAAWRARDRRSLIAFTDGLVRLFQSRFAPLVAARSLGLLAFDVSPAAKAALAGLSRGFAAAQPRLARGLDLNGVRRP